MDYLRTIQLGYGCGEPGAQACWMSALSVHIGEDWSDTLSCVSPVINDLCININDSYDNHNKERTEDILEFGLFDPLGTADFKNENKRKNILNAAKEKWAQQLDANVLHFSELEMIPYHHFDDCFDKFREFLKKEVYPCLRQMINAGKHAPKEPAMSCTKDEFLEKIGCGL